MITDKYIDIVIEVDIDIDIYSSGLVHDSLPLYNYSPSSLILYIIIIILDNVESSNFFLIYLIFSPFKVSMFYSSNPSPW